MSFFAYDDPRSFRGFKKELLQKIQLDSSGFAISPEFAIKTHIAGIQVGEGPTEYYDRVEGVSSFKLWRMAFTYLLLFVKLFWQRYR